jgi:hypothetical protein
MYMDLGYASSSPDTPPKEVGKDRDPSLLLGTGSPSSAAVQFTWESVDESKLPVVQAGGGKMSECLLDSSIRPDRPVRMSPIQMHMHSVSEHTVNGLYVRPDPPLTSLIGSL